MSEEKSNVVDLNSENPATGDIKSTDFVEPQGKFRKVIKWVAGGLALVATGVTGFFIGRKTGDHDDDDETEAEADSNETADE